MNELEDKDSDEEDSANENAELSDNRDVLFLLFTLRNP